MSEKIEPITILRPGMRVRVKKGYEHRFFLRIYGTFAKAGDILTICDVQIKEVMEKNISDTTKLPFTKVVMGFLECCSECQQGKGHHEVIAAHMIFEYLGDVDLATTKLPKGWYHAEDVAEMMFKITECWNPQHADILAKVCVGNLEYEILTPSNPSIRCVCISETGSFTKFEKFPIRYPAEQGTHSDDRVPTAQVIPLLNLYEKVKVELDSIRAMLSEFHKLTTELMREKQA